MLFKELSALNKKESASLLKRRFNIDDVLPIAKKIVNDVKSKGDSAIRKYTQKFDKVKLAELRVSQAEFARAEKELSGGIKDVLKRAYMRVYQFHTLGIIRDFETTTNDGARLGRIVVPYHRAGVYIPGGLAAYPSSLVMAAAPAKAAGVGEVILCTPPRKDGSIHPAVLYTAKICGVKNIFKVGGAQAIAALAYGTDTIPKVDIIVGPGNKFVTAAKKLVSDEVAIDFLAGPSEILIISDGSANPKFIAADMISQAEHDTAAQSVFITTNKKQAEAVREEIKLQSSSAKRAAIIKKSLAQNGALLIAKTLDEAIGFANDYASEHLIIATKNPQGVLERIKNAGAVFLGEYSPVAIGDYCSGPNSTLPTMAEAKFASGLDANTFLRAITYEELKPETLKRLADDAMQFAELEGLTAHKKAIQVRL